MSSLRVLLRVMCSLVIYWIMFLCHVLLLALIWVFV